MLLLIIVQEPGWGSDPNILDQVFTIGTTGNAIQLEGGGEDAVLPFASPLNASNSGPGGSVYLSFLIDVVGYNSASLSEYRLIHYGVDNGSGGYNAGSGLMVGPGAAANTFKIGYSNSDVTADAVWFGTEYPYQDLTDPTSSPVLNQFFIVIKFTFGVSGGADGFMWVNPAVNTTEPAADLTQDSSLASKSPLSVSENEISNSVKLYPNPARDFITIESKSVKLSSVDMYNVLGAKVLSTELSNNNRVNVSNLGKGVYFMKLYAEEGGSATKRVVIQ